MNHPYKIVDDFSVVNGRLYVTKEGKEYSQECCYDKERHCGYWCPHCVPMKSGVQLCQDTILVKR